MRYKFKSPNLKEFIVLRKKLSPFHSYESKLRVLLEEILVGSEIRRGLSLGETSVGLGETLPGLGETLHGRNSLWAKPVVTEILHIKCG